MGRLRRLLFGASLCLAALLPSHAFAQVERWADQISEASGRFGIPAAWIRRVMTAESGGRTMLNGRPIRSQVGAMGLMQLMPGTWQAMRAAQGLGPDPDDPRDNILAGTAYLRLMYDRFGYPGLFAAYNAGPGAYAAWLGGRRRLPAETVAYVAQVGRAEAVGARRALGPPARSVEPAAAAPVSLFAMRRADAGPASGSPPSQAPPRPGASLFVVMRTTSP